MSGIVVSTTSDEFARRVRLAVGGDRVRILQTAPGKQRRAGDSAMTGRMGDPMAIILQVTAAEMPDVLVFGPGVPTETALAVATYLDEHYPRSSVVLATGAGPDEWLDAMQVGIRDVVDPDADVTVLRVVLDRAAVAAQARGRAMSPTAAGQLRGRVIPVASPKGGCGKTMIATNLAVGLAKLAPHQAVIVDFDLQFGDVATTLQLTPTQGLAEALQERDLDGMALKTFLTPHPSGLYVLSGPEIPARADAITEDDIGKLLDLLADQFRFVIVDTAPGLNDHTLAIFDRASDVVLVAGMDVPSIRGLAKEREILQQLSLTDSMTEHIVLNFADRRTGLTVKDVEAVIGTDVDVVVPRANAIPLSTNRGIPLLQSGGRSPAAKQLQKLVNLFYQQPQISTEPEPKHRAWAWSR